MSAGPERSSRLPPLVVMGVAGCGKSVVGAALARVLGVGFVEGDAFHPSKNIARMASGIPLDDAHRAGWLDAVAAEIASRTAQGATVIATCSALKRRYRDRLRGRNPGLVFLHLALDREAAYERVQARGGHFMPASLVDSQFADLEPPSADETALTLDATLPVDGLVAEAAAFLTTQPQ
jgi:gluconokinase